METQGKIMEKPWKSHSLTGKAMENPWKRHGFAARFPQVSELRSQLLQLRGGALGPRPLSPQLEAVTPQVQQWCHGVMVGTCVDRLMGGSHGRFC